MLCLHECHADMYAGENCFGYICINVYVVATKSCQFVILCMPSGFVIIDYLSRLNWDQKWIGSRV